MTGAIFGALSCLQLPLSALAWLREVRCYFRLSSAWQAQSLIMLQLATVDCGLDPPHISPQHSTLPSLTLSMSHSAPRSALTLRTPHASRSALYTGHLALRLHNQHTIHCTVGTPRPQSTLHVTLYTPRFTLYTPHSTLYIPHSTLLTSTSMLPTSHTHYMSHSTLHPLHSQTTAPHYTLHTLHSALQNPCLTLHTSHTRAHTHTCHHGKCKSSSENIARLLRLSHKTTFDALGNTAECHEVPRRRGKTTL